MCEPNTRYGPKLTAADILPNLDEHYKVTDTSELPFIAPG